MFEIASATLEDVPSMSRIIFETYRGNRNSMANYMYPTESQAMLAWRIKTMARKFHDPAVFYQKVTDVSTGEIVAYARWQSPHPRAVEEDRNMKEQRKNLESFPKGSNVELAKAYDSALNAKMAKYADPEKDYVLKALNTRPAYHRKGCASMLIQQGIEIADAEGARIYLDATPAGTSLYLKFGWKIIDAVVFDLHEHGYPHAQTTTCMMREPTGGKKLRGQKASTILISPK